MVDLTLEPACEHVKKKDTKHLGGPGIRTQVPLDFVLAPLPTQPMCLIVSIINNEYYMGNINNMPEN